MTAIDIIKHNTGLNDDLSAYYAEIAEMQIRTYLNYSDTDDIDKFKANIAALATIFYNSEKNMNNLTEQNSIGIKSESFSEGAVSVSKTYLNSAEIADNTQQQINNELSKLRQYRKVKVL